MSRVLDILDRSKARFSRQAPWRPLWQDLAEILLPGRANFTSQLGDGDETGADIYDTTPRQANRGLATAIDGLLKSSVNRWFWMKAGQESLNEEDEAKRWFDAVGNSMWASIYNPSAGFIPQSGEVDSFLSTFGWGCLWTGENKDHNGLNFKSIFIGDVAIEENADGQIDTADIILRYTARQSLQKWKDESKLGPKLREALGSSNPKDRDKVFEFRQCVAPRGEYDQRKRDNLNMPFEDVIVCVDDEHIVEESGHMEFPMAVPRWGPGNPYPRSPGMMAFPDARTLQAMGHTLLVGGQMAVDPPRWVVDGSFSAVRAWPGGLTVVDADTIQATNGRPIGTLETGANIPVGREMQQDYRTMVEAAFFKNVFNLPDPEGKQMTAYEVAQRKEEYLRTIGPVMGQLENDYVGAIVNRVFGIMMRRSVDDRGEPVEGGPFPPVPDSLKGVGARFEFMSPIQRAQKQIEAAGMAQAFEFLGPLLAIKPKAALRLDVDQIVQDMPEVYGLPQRWLRPKDEYEAELAQIAEAEAQAAEAMQIGQAAEIGKTAADGVKSVAQADAAMA